MSTEKDLNYWKANAEEDYKQVPISVLRYITELEKVVNNVDLDDVIIICPECKNAETVEDLIQYTKERNS